MAHCVNRSSEEFKTLAEQSNMNPVILAAKVSLWQEENGLDNFPALNDIVEVKSSVASKETVEQMKKVAEQMGVNLIALDEYIKGNPDVNVKGVNGLADLMKGIIAIAQGKEDVALTEEMVHIATSIIEQVNPQLVTNLISKISQYKIYNIVLEKYKTNKAYQLPNGKPNIRKIKKEAVDKLIAEMIINMSEGTTEFPELLEKESRNLVQQMWDAILSSIRALYRKSDIDLFQQTAQQISEGNLGAKYYKEVKPGVKELFESNPELANIGTQGQYSAYIDTNPQTERGSQEDVEGFKLFMETAPAEFKGEGIFFQLEENEKVNETFGKFKDMNDRMDFTDASETEKRHYKYDGKPLEFTVTTLKKKKTLKEQTNKSY